MSLDHATIEEQHLVQRYLQGKLSEGEEQAFEEHYLTCDHCLEQLHLAERLHRGLRAVAVEETARALSTAAAVGWWHRLGRAGRRVIVTAVLVLALLPTLLLYRQNRQLANALTGLPAAGAAPAGSTLVLDLSPVRSGMQPVTTIEPHPAEVPYLVLFIAVPGEHRRHHVRLLASDDTQVWRSGPLVADPGGSLVLTLPAAFLDRLARGEYRLAVSGITRNGNEGAVTSYPLHLQ